MKNLVFLASMLISVFTFAQNQDLNEIKVTAPRFQNDIFESVNDFLTNNVEYPANSKNAGLQGTEVLQFTVSTNGEISDFKIINSVSPEIDIEVIRSLEATNGKWKPGTSDGLPTAMPTEVSLVFFLNTPEDIIETAKQYQQKGNTWMYVKNNPEKALKYYNLGIKLLPNEESLLAARILCKYETGDKDGANKDLERLNILAKRNGSNVNLEKLAGINKYDEMLQATKK